MHETLRDVEIRIRLSLERGKKDWNADQWNTMGMHYYSGTNGCEKNYCNARLCFENALSINSQHRNARNQLQLIHRAGVDQIFEAAYNNDIAQLEKLLLTNPTLLNAKFIETSPIATQMLAWTTYLLIKGVGVMSAGVAFAGFMTLTAETAGTHLVLSSGFVESTRRLLWVNDYDKVLRYSMSIRIDWTPLHFAALAGAIDAAKFLIAQGADTTAQANGKTYAGISESAQFNAECAKAILRRDTLQRQHADNISAQNTLITRENNGRQRLETEELTSRNRINSFWQPFPTESTKKLVNNDSSSSQRFDNCNCDQDEEDVEDVEDVEPLTRKGFSAGQ